MFCNFCFSCIKYVVNQKLEHVDDIIQNGDRIMVKKGVPFNLSCKRFSTV